MSFAPVSCLSESDEEVVSVPARGRKRPRERVVPKEEKVQLCFLQAMLGKDCKCQKKTCFRQFLNQPILGELETYRREWFDLDKLDQDTVVACPS